MSFPEPMTVILTVIFAVSGIGFLYLLIRPCGWQDRVTAALHVLMSVAMLGMPWAWGTLIAPPLAQVIVFSLATAYFLVLFVIPRASSASGSSGSHAAHGGRLILGYHAVMMASMVVMAVMMGGWPVAGSSGGSMSGSMPGMSGGSMNGMSGGTSSSRIATGSSGEQVLSWLFVVVFAAATIWLLVRVIGAISRGAGWPRWATDAVLLMMSAGMALAFLPR